MEYFIIMHCCVLWDNAGHLAIVPECMLLHLLMTALLSCARNVSQCTDQPRHVTYFHIS